MKHFSRFAFLPVLLTSFLLSGCLEDKKSSASPSAAPEVAYVVVTTEEVSVVNELPGRLESYRNSDVRARVAGVLEKRLFEEGAQVKKNQKLFIIDPRSYEASVQTARAALARAEANFVQADLKHKRYVPLVAINAVSKQDFDDATAAQKQAAADVASAKAALVNAKLDLEYATVLAPIPGRIGRSFVTEGALVGQGNVTLLATIQQIDPIYLNLTQSSAELLRLQQAMRKGTLKGASEEGLRVTLIMEDGTTYPHAGKLLFSDITVDPSTGEFSIRALFPNPETMLLPGMYVRARLEQAVNEKAITIPQQAVQRQKDTSTVTLINKDGIAEVRNVKTGASLGDKWVILEGLTPGERVIVEGLQRARPGVAVKPIIWNPVATPEKAKPDTPAPDNASAAPPATPAEPAADTKPQASTKPQANTKPQGNTPNSQAKGEQ
ncbi:MAG: efflux RND transporter periplasmic adaptor subunit [Burkholderiaceae bacterium]|jgi:membrane fusion protein (multidrug efflux system)|nr:efflux RND transporter periplasmic adaptor subunit [Burkholderiaceae bacterium]